MAELTLIGMSSCPNCKMVHKTMTEKGIRHEYILAEDPAGLAVAQKYHVTSVPTLVLENGSVLHTVGEIMEYIG